MAVPGAVLACASTLFQSGVSIHQLVWFDYALLIPYFILMAVLAIYGLHRYEVIWTYVKHRRKQQPQPKARFTELPRDKVIVVVSTKILQIERLRRRNQLSEEQARAMLSSQMPLEEKTKVADYVIQNEGSIEETRQKARSIFQELKRIALQPKGHQAQ